MKLKSILGILAILFTLGLIFMPVTGCGCSKISATKAACLSHIKQQGLAFTLYTSDENDQYPNRDVWMDSIAPYVKDQSIFKEPLKPVQPYGYAFNSKLSNAKVPKAPEKTPLVYDSVNPIRNASDPAVSLPSPGRHSGMDIIGYADGHGKAVKVGVQPK